MQGNSESAEPWFRPMWEDEGANEAEAIPAGRAPPDWLDRPRAAPSDGLDAAALLRPLAAAATALARLDARVEGAAPAVAEGLGARLALREAAGWLAHQHRSWVHPIDLALREAGLTGSTTAAAVAGRLRTALPVTSAIARVADASSPAEVVVAEDLAIGQALNLARLWRRLAEHRGSPLSDATTLRETLARLGDVGETALADWLARFAAPPKPDALPPLLRAAQAAQAWTHDARKREVEGRDSLSTVGVFLAAAVWQRYATPLLALPLWSATPGQLDRLALLTGPVWLGGCLDCVADAAQRAGQELTRLEAAAAKAAGLRLRHTARSHLPAAVDLALRRPVLTARGLATELGISPQAALGLLAQLVAAGVLREATGRAAWRAFATG